MKNVFKEVLNNNGDTLMSFDNREPLSYVHAITTLFEGKPIEQGYAELLENIKAYLVGQPQVNQGITAIKFHEWVSSIHNEHLVPATGQQLPKNVVYDILKGYRDQNAAGSLEEEDLLVLFMMEGLNARKIMNGDTPTTNFISTALANKVAGALNKLGIADERTKDFITKYKADDNLQETYNSFMAELFQLKDTEGSLIYILNAANALDLSKVENSVTGANKYVSNPLQHTQALSPYSPQQIIELSMPVIEFLNRQSAAFEQLMPAIINKEELPINHELVLWDISEYLAKILLALEITNLQTPIEVENVLNLPFIAEIISRNKEGNYPVAKEREKDIESLEQITKLFLQVELHNNSIQQLSAMLDNDNDVVPLLVEPDDEVKITGDDGDNGDNADV